MNPEERRTRKDWQMSTDKPIIAHFRDVLFHKSETFIYHLAVNLKSFHPVYVADQFINVDQFPIPGQDRFFIGGDKYSPQRFFRKIFRRCFGVDRMLEQTLRKAGAAILHAHFGTTGTGALKAKKALGIPLVTSFYGFDVSLAGQYEEWRNRYKQLFQQGDLFLAEGPFLGKRLEALGCPVEKIRIQKSTGRRNKKQMDWLYQDEAHAAEEANRRLQAIASLPHLAVFSDEAHHTYGQKLLGEWKVDRETGQEEFIGKGIKKVRRTVDFLAQETNLIVVVNTTGTPYFERQPLRDVVIWYGLGEGIHDCILKELANNIRIFNLDDARSEDLVEQIVTDFVDDYWDVSLPDGSPARLALYFPQTQAMDELRPAIETVLAMRGIDAATVLPVHNKSSAETRTEFYRVANDPASPYRIILLVNMGTEGWNCPSLFACGLVRKLKSSNNFVLQAATRCLRQVPGNTTPARVYVSQGNKAILARQLEETFGTTLQDLNAQHADREEKIVVLRRPQLPPLLLRKKVLRYRRKPAAGAAALRLERPEVGYQAGTRVETWTMAEPGAGRSRLTRVDGGEEIIELAPHEYSLYGAAAMLAGNYHLPSTQVHQALRAAYGPDGLVPEYHLEALGAQIEAQGADYETYEEEIDVAVALVKSSGFDVHEQDGQPVYTARVSFAKDRAHLYRTAEQLPDGDLARRYSFHYEGYNFDSQPEAEFLERVLNLIAKHPDRIDGVWFTGGITHPDKTELYAEYLGEDRRWHRYTPDFVIRRADGKHLIVEIKSDAHSAEVSEDLARYENGEPPKSREGRKAVALQRWQDLNPEVLHYKVVFANGMLQADAMDAVQAFLA